MEAVQLVDRTLRDAVRNRRGVARGHRSRYSGPCPVAPNSGHWPGRTIAGGL